MSSTPAEDGAPAEEAAVGKAPEAITSEAAPASLRERMLASPDTFPGLAERIEDLVRSELRARLVAPEGDLPALRAVAAAVGPDLLGEALAALKPVDLNKALSRLDPLYGAGSVPRLLALATGGAEPRRAMDLATMDLAELRSHGADDREGLAEVLGKAPRLAVAELLGRVDPGFVVPSRGEPERLVARVLDLAGGAEPRPDINAAADIAGLQAFRAGLDRDTFLELVEGLPTRGAEELLVRLDPDFPAAGRAAASKGRLAALAEGAEAAPALDDAAVDLAGLREAGARSGQSFAMAWAKALPNPQAKALARRLDPERPDVKGLTAPELVEAIVALSMGEPTMAEREAAPSIDGITAFEAAYGEGEHPYAGRRED